MLDMEIEHTNAKFHLGTLLSTCRLALCKLGI